MYVETGVPFLLDESDTLLAYEKKAKTESVTCDDVLLSCISSLDHVQQLDIIYRTCYMTATGAVCVCVLIPLYMFIMFALYARVLNILIVVNISRFIVFV